MIAQPAADSVTTPQLLVSALGGRYSTSAGINVDAGDHEVDRWFLAATLFGTRISASVAVRTYRVMNAAGVATIEDAGAHTWDDLVALLDRGGYARYDFRTATRLRDLAEFVSLQHPAGIARLGAECDHPRELVATLDALPGWGPTTIGAFLRELRGVWPTAQPPLDSRVEAAAAHLGLCRSTGQLTLPALQRLARDAGIDARDLEAALVRLSLAHGRGFEACDGTVGPCSYVSSRA
jgi:hypothetical protein